MGEKLTAISLFSGALGLDIGLDQSGFCIRAAVENDKWAVQTIQRNAKRLKNSRDIEVFDRDIHEVTTREILRKCGLKVGETTVVTGGPACQTFSTAGGRASLDDPRGNLFLQYIRIVEEARPRFFVMENVKGILSAAVRHRRLSERGPGFPPLAGKEELGSGFRAILSRLQKTGYYIVFGLLNAADFGVPQKRERLIILGSRDGELLKLPFPTHLQHGMGAQPKWLTLRDGLRRLDDPDPEYTPFTRSQVRYLKSIPAGGNWRHLPPRSQEHAIGGAYSSWGGRSGFLRRLSWRQPSPALTTDPRSSATMLCHPDELRPLSTREYARLQQFPDSWVFVGSPAQKYRQIGNAVPVGLGKAIGEALLQTMHSAQASQSRRGLVVCESPGLLESMAQGPRTILNPPRMRGHRKAASPKAWLGEGSWERRKLVSYIKALGIPRQDRKLRTKAHEVTRILHKTYRSPSHNNKSDPLDELIFILLSLMTTGPSYSRVYDRLKQEYRHWSQLIDVPSSQLVRTIRDAGLSRQKAPRILSCLKRIRRAFGRVTLDPLRDMPDTQAEEFLLSLPGIGVKAAKCVLMYSLGRKVLPVDTHVARVSRRLGLIPNELPAGRIHDRLEMLVDPDDRYRYHVNVLAHGQRVCHAKAPACPRCVLRRRCEYFRHLGD